MAVVDVITSLRKLNANIQGGLDVVNNLYAQIRAVETAGGDEMALALLQLSLDEELETLESFFDELTGHVSALGERVATMKQADAPSDTFISDMILLMRHLTSAVRAYNANLESLQTGAVQSDTPFQAVSLCDEDFGLVRALNRLRADLQVVHKVD